MNNQQILDKKPNGNYKSVKILSGKPSIWVPEDYRSINDIERIVELEKAIRYATDYLDDNKLNQIGHGSKAHNELKDVLKSGGDL